MRLDCTDIPGGFILGDAELAPQSEWFEPNHWRQHGAGEPLGKGRGLAVSAGVDGQWALRHYRRGGLPGRVIEDAYLWRGFSAARPVRELRLLSRLRKCGVPVVRAVAARVLRSGFVYSGDLLTERVARARTLGECAPSLEIAEWTRVGEAIAHFHAAGGWHADLNAHNILMAPTGICILDLDRGRLVRPGAASQRRNLDRLNRSLFKLGLLPGVASGWQSLLQAYRSR